MALDSLAKYVIVAGVVLAGIGVLLLLVSKIPFFGHLPGDFLIKRDGFTFYFPLVTMLLLSVIMTIVVNVVIRIFRG